MDQQFARWVMLHVRSNPFRGVQASFDFRGAKNTAAGRMLTVIFTNDLDGAVYA